MKRVLFVCVENSNRSQMAEAFARLHGGGQVEAISGGQMVSYQGGVRGYLDTLDGGPGWGLRFTFTLLYPK